MARNGESGSEARGAFRVAHAQLRICIHRGSCPEEESERGMREEVEGGEGKGRGWIQEGERPS